MTRNHNYEKEIYESVPGRSAAGVVLLLAMVIAGRGLGASGGIKYCVVSIVGAVSPEHVNQTEFYSGILK
jgi:hypothetical protein